MTLTLRSGQDCAARASAQAAAASHTKTNARNWRRCILPLPRFVCSLALIDARFLQRLLLRPLLARWTDRTWDDTSSRLSEREATRLAPARSPKVRTPRPRFSRPAACGALA